ncbi:MAG: phenylacetic acid degradation operon negative regulatory protein [Arenicella sp.]|jgi:phenylacetic acid degradation operon negative regulatory protein
MQLPSSQSSIEEDIGEFLDSLLQDRRVHAKSLVSTFFGDVVAANDGYAWVQTVFAALELLGVNDRLVRTTLFRLREEDWLAATRSGRKSYYQLTTLGDMQTRRAERLIYYSDRPAWDGSWTLVFLVVQSLDAELRRELEQELSWIGFGPVTKRVWAHPGSDIELVAEPINRLGLRGKVIAMRCENIQNVELGLDIDDRELAAMCMPVSEVESAYKQFIQDFSPLLDERGKLTMQGGNAEMLSLRLLMMDEYRRAILRDPHLPMELLPDNWVGYEAFSLCGKIYRQIYQAANVHYQHLQHNAGAVDDSLSAESVNSRDAPNYAMRFPVEK